MDFFAKTVLWSVIIFGGVLGLLWLVTPPYHLEAIYCNPNMSSCVYRNERTHDNKCSIFWDDSNLFDKVNNLKLKDGTCKITKRGS